MSVLPGDVRSALLRGGDLDLEEIAAASTDGVTVAGVSADELEPAVRALAATPSARLADFFADTGSNGETVLRMVWALDDVGCYLVLESPALGEEYPALSDVAPAAFIEECEIYEQFARRPSGGKPLNRVAVPPQEDDLPRLGRAPVAPPSDVHAPHAVGGHAFEFPFGPVRAAGVESLYYGLVTSGEEVIDLYLFTWHKHRGIEWRLRGMTPSQALFLVERVEGLSAVANGWAFAAAAERALGLTVAADACRSRAIALELERLYNHAAAVAALCQATGLSVGQANAEIALERLLRVNAAVLGHRYLFGVVTIGGVSRAPDVSALRRELSGACAELKRVTSALSSTNSFLDRLEATGVVNAEGARRLGLVGPVARAAGLSIDVRCDHPDPPYTDLAPKAATRSSGDVLARYQVFLGEIEESTRLLEVLAGAEALGDTVEPRSAAGSALGWAESPRGESLCWLRLDGAGRIDRARLRPAAVRNWRAFDDAARSQNVFTDIPIIEASFWLTVAGTAR